jgi:Bacterial membrane protein YfhO
LRVLPRAWLATEALVVGEAQALEVIRAGRLPTGQEWEPRRTALVEEAAGAGLRAGAGAGRVEFVLRHPNRVELRTTSDAPSILVLGDNHYPGWEAEVDGRAARVLRVNYNLRGVELPAGEHAVCFTYRPRSLVVGLFVSLLTLAALALWAGQGRLKSTAGGSE